MLLSVTPLSLNATLIMGTLVRKGALTEIKDAKSKVIHISGHFFVDGVTLM